MERKTDEKIKDKNQSKTDLQILPEIKSGQTIKVHQKVKEGDKERIQIFEGIVIAHKGGRSKSATITVRKISADIGVERIFPLHSPQISKIEIVKKGRVRRSKLYFLRHSRKQLNDQIKIEKTKS